MGNLSEQAQRANELRSSDLSYAVRIGGRRFKFMREEQELLSRTWKERHAKGVPVKMSWDEFGKFSTKMIWDNPEIDCFYKFSAETPTRRLSISFHEDGIWARFCNFRYKQSWLDKELTKINDGLEKFYNSGEWTGKKGGERA